MTCHELPPTARELCAAFVGGLKEILHAKLYGVYLYGAAVFPNSGPIQDIDCHVILEESHGEVGHFLEFASERIREARNLKNPIGKV